MKLALAAVLAAGSIARAEPAHYFEGGAAAGITGDKHEAGAFVAGTFDSGIQLGNSPIWAHAAVLVGALTAIDSGPTSSGSYLSTRAGLEVRRCIVDAACGAAGIDLGIRRQEYMAEEGGFENFSAFVVPRIQGDFGGRAIRIRPGAQASIGARGVDGFALTLGVAYTP